MKNETSNMNPMRMPDITQHPLFNQAHALALEQIKKEPMSPTQVNLYIRQVITNLTGVGIRVVGADGIHSWPLPASLEAWKESILEDYIECMICGMHLDVLTAPHFKNHGGTKEQYHIHFGIPLDVKLASGKYLKNKRRHMQYKTTLVNKKKKPTNKVEYDINDFGVIENKADTTASMETEIIKNSMKSNKLSDFVDIQTKDYPSTNKKILEEMSISNAIEKTMEFDIEDFTLLR